MTNIVSNYTQKCNNRFISNNVESVYIYSKMLKIIHGGYEKMKILLNEVRQNKKITLAKLEQQTGISKSALNNFENERTSPTMIQMEKLAKALEVRIIELFDSEYK